MKIYFFIFLKDTTIAMHILDTSIDSGDLIGLFNLKWKYSSRKN
jgi:hypothetical protein